MASKPDIFGNYTDEKGILKSATTKQPITDIQKKQIQDFIKHMKTYNKPIQYVLDTDMFGNPIKNEAGIDIKEDGNYYVPAYYADDYEELLPLPKKKTIPKIKQLSPPSSKSSNSSIVSDIFGADTPTSSVTNSSTTTSTKSSKSKTKSTKSNSDVIIPIVGETELAVPEFFATPYTNKVVDKKTKKETTYIRYRLVNPLTKARNLSQRKGQTSIKLIRKPVENAIIMAHTTDHIPLNLFSKKDRETIDKHFQVIKDYKDTPIKEIPDSKDFYNGERGRPEVLQKNIDVMRSRVQMPNTRLDVFVGGKEGGEDRQSSNQSFESPNISFNLSEPPTPKPKREYKRIKPLKYATEAEAKKALQKQKNESGKLKRDTAKYGLEKAIQLRDEKRAKESEKGENWWVSGLVDDIVKRSEKKGEGIKNIIFSNNMKKGKKVCGECGMKECCCSSSDNEEGCGLYAGKGLYAGGGLYASGSAPSGRGIQHIHHYHTTEMSGEGIIHHHHHLMGGSIKSIGKDIKKAFQPVKNAFDKVEKVATPYNAEVTAHYILPAATSALGGAAGSAVGGLAGGVLGSAAGAYGGQQLNKEIGIDDNTTFKGMGMKRPAKGSQAAKDYMAKIRGMRKK